MEYILKVHEDAIIDIQDAFEWYEAKKDGLGFEFIEEIKAGFQHICSHPQYYNSINQHFRRFKISRFPYLLSMK